MKRVWVLGLAVVVVFAAVSFLLLQLMPQPLKNADYLVAGSVATLVSLLVVFVMVAGAKGAGGLFLKRRRKK
jgi:uncharacterized membrane protein